ncbi:MAG: AMMECR1 domain-containing protein [Candidatus Gracilibacteria bacterium]
MQKVVRSIIQSVLFENKTPSIEDIKKIVTNLPEKSLPVFVTLYDAEKIIGSAGKLYPTNKTFIEELIENTEGAMKDSRFASYKANPETTRNLKYRVDTFENSNRRMLHHPDDMDTKTEGMIIICRKQKKIGVILPGMFPETLSGEDVYHLLAKKIELNLQDVGKGDLIIYGLKTHIFKD